MFYGYFFNSNAETNASGSLVTSREIELPTCDKDAAIYVMQQIAHAFPAANSFTLYKDDAKTGRVFNL